MRWNKQILRMMAMLMLSSTISAVLPAQVPAKTIPAFTFYSLSGKAFTQKDLPAGRQLFFVFFDPGCEHCQKTIGNMNKQPASFANAAMIMLSMAPVKQVEDFVSTYATALKRQKYFTLLQDRQYQFITRFKPKKYPSLFLYSAAHELLLYADNEEMLPTFVKLMHATKK